MAGGSFDPAQIDKELGWAQGMGMTTMRVFLHDSLWQQDAPGFKKRIDIFLAIAARHGIRPLLVLFDSCWDPNSKLGPQHPPIPGVHNSGWVQAPGAARWPMRRNIRGWSAYVKDMVGSFAGDTASWAGTCGTSPTTSDGDSYRRRRQGALDRRLLLAQGVRMGAIGRSRHSP